MAHTDLDVTFTAEDTYRLPDVYREGACLLMDLQRRGLITPLQERLKVNRQGGYSACDAWNHLLMYYSAGATKGLRPSWGALGPHAPVLAAITGRRSLPSPASMSRILNAVETELIRPEAGWMLTEFTGVDAVITHPAAQSYDALGQGWHVFDVDPTARPFHHRDLPDAEDLPKAHRYTEETCARGYTGRKRGDALYRACRAQHAGSAATVHHHLTLGNGEGVVEFEYALDSVVVLCERLSLPPERVMVRMDGEHGNVPWFTACRERNLPFVTRLNRPHLLRKPEVFRRLRSATWFQVPDSLAGPQRAAADLGILKVRPGQKTRRSDGSRYESLEIRVVASIFPKRGDAKRGVVLDGWQVELFAVDLEPETWPASDAVAVYFGRCGQENRYSQEERELGTNRLLSGHLPGQEFAVLAALTLWNLRISRGFELNPPPAVAPVQQLRQPVVDERVPGGWPADPVVNDLLGSLPWDTLLGAREHWRWDAKHGDIVCAEDRRLRLTTVRPSENSPGKTGLIFRRPKGGGQACPHRPGCLSSPHDDASKHVQLSVPTEVAAVVRERLRAVRGKSKDIPLVSIKPITGSPGCLIPTESMFLPAAARAAVRALFERATLHLVLKKPAPSPLTPSLVADNPTRRQHRRMTWAERRERYAIRDGTRLRVGVAAKPALKHFLNGESSRESIGESCA